jgi:hypothetical protein
VLAVLLALLLAACGGQGSALEAAFPGDGRFSGWQPVGGPTIFDQETLYDLVNGQAEAYFAYGFEQVAVRGYEDANGQRVDVEIWQVSTPANAYGVFTANRAGEPVSFGNEGDADAGRRIAFWQDRYYVRVRVRQQLPDAVLQAFAQALSDSLPAGGQRPPLVDRLPADGLVPHSVVFFHEEISIQSQLWLGGENVLALSAETDGVLATYQRDGATAQVLLVAYPDGGAAATARQALTGSDVGGLVQVEALDTILGAVFGGVDEPVANGWLAEALAN